MEITAKKSMYISDLDGDEEDSSRTSPIVSGGATLSDKKNLHGEPQKNNLKVD